MKYIWTEDTGAGLHFWELANEHLFQGGGLLLKAKGATREFWMRSDSWCQMMGISII